MSKEAEQEYLKRLAANTGGNGVLHVTWKPFSDDYVAVNLAAMGALFTLLPRPPARLLDLGCGSGWTSNFFARAGYDVVGQDIAQDMLDIAAIAKKDFHIENLQFVLSDYENLPFEAEFDCAVFFDSLHHCDDERAAIRSVYRALKPGGILLTHEPGEGHAANPHSQRAMELYGVNERDMPPQLIMDAARTAGFTEFEIYPMPADLLRLFYDRERRLNTDGTRHRAATLWHKLRTLAKFQRLHQRSGAIVLARKPG